ncbi:MAG TPA: DNA polymerase III subunit gamma and tau [Streptosporangiaceae bacterium]|nr:DNA polymerase III subunit gamma and tau [Streptosporangiaceae bacterium]
MAADADSPKRESVARESPAPLALYRRYRPATFAELKGQDHVTEPLRQALRSGRVNHAYLFSGPRGCGKTSSARILARSLNCELGPTPDPCGKCASCVALAPSGPGSIDVIEIDAASHGGIDDARDLRERAFYSPVSARYKIYIIDEAHMVTGAGFNALLKLVEEPPPHLKFVFATTEPEKVIPTIRSRTHHYPFRLVPPTILRDLLEEILAAEKIEFEPSVLPVVIRAGAGSVRDSLSVLDQLIAGAGDEGLRYDRAIALLGYTDDALLDEMAEAFAAGDGSLVFKAIDHVVEGGHDPRRFAMDLLDRLRDLIILAAVPDAGVSGLLDVPEDQLESMREQAKRFGQDRLVRAAETISNGLIEMRGATSPRLLLELMCAQVLLPAASAVPAGGSGGSSPRASTGQAAVAAGGPLDARVDRLERELRGALDRLATLTSAAGAGTGRSADVRRESVGADREDTAPPPPRRPEQRTEQPRRQEAARPEQTRPEQTRPAESHPAESRQAESRQAESRLAESRLAEPRLAEPRLAEPRPASPSGAGASAGPSGGSALPDASVLRSRWPDILESVREVRKVAWILLGNASVESVEGNVLSLAFEREGDAKGFGSSGCDQDLANVLDRMFGVRPVIRAVVQSGPARGGGPTGATGGRTGSDSARSDSARSDSARSDSARSDSGRSDNSRSDSSRSDSARSDRAQAQAERASTSTDRSWPQEPPPDYDDEDGPPPSTSRARRPDPPAAESSDSPPRRASVRASTQSNGNSVPRPSMYDDPREQTDPDQPGTAEVSGTDLIMRELGGKVIEEIGEG